MIETSDMASRRPTEFQIVNEQAQSHWYVYLPDPSGRSWQKLSNSR
jgi:hypothetical protein